MYRYINPHNDDLDNSNTILDKDFIYESKSIKNVELSIKLLSGYNHKSLIFAITREILSQNTNEAICEYTPSISNSARMLLYIKNTNFIFEDNVIEYNYIDTQYKDSSYLYSSNCNFLINNTIIIKCYNWNKTYMEFIEMIKRLKNKYIDEFRVKNIVNEITSVYLYTAANGWSGESKIKRLSESIFLKNGIKANILTYINNFKNFNNNKFPGSNRLVIMLEGPPGTGKSSLIMTIAGLLNTSIFHLEQDDLTIKNLNICIRRANQCSKLPIFVIEDADSMFANTDTEVVGIELGSNMKLNAPIMTNPNISYSNILNIIDGNDSQNDAMFIFTTNNEKKFPPAFQRRIHKKFHIEGFDCQSIADMINYYIQLNIEPSNRDIKTIERIMINKNFQMFALYNSILNSCRAKLNIQNVVIQDIIDELTNMDSYYV